MDTDDSSDLLFGRYQALRLYATIARLPTPNFKTGDVVALSGLHVPACSKELARLVTLGLIKKSSRRGDYERNDETPFWSAMDALAANWGMPHSETED